MLIQLLISGALIIVTMLIHGVGMVLGVRWLERDMSGRVAPGTFVRRVWVVGLLVLVMAAATLVETVAWALAFLWTGALEHFEEALYFSMVTFTTLGYGDVTLVPQWRLLSAFAAVNGIIMFGWTTAVIVYAVRHLSRPLQRLESRYGTPGEDG